MMSFQNITVMVHPLCQTIIMDVVCISTNKKFLKTHIDILFQPIRSFTNSYRQVTIKSLLRAAPRMVRGRVINARHESKKGKKRRPASPSLSPLLIKSLVYL